jgi:hypothetical protein
MKKKYCGKAGRKFYVKMAYHAAKLQFFSASQIFLQIYIKKIHPKATQSSYSISHFHVHTHT